ncbi:MAG: S9 family peptidase, partial [Xanthomonadales bacterium]|nr:S9 family peptidase [Xanthomonadales bacterium]
MSKLPPDTSTQLPAPEQPAPVAEQRPFEQTDPFGKRADPYAWLRDDTRSQPEVLDHLRAEHAYFEARFAPLNDLRDRLFEEMRGRIKEDDAEVPTFEDGYWYYTRFEEGHQYPIFARRLGSLEAEEQVILDANERAEGHGYYQPANVIVSEDGRIMAVAEDTVGRREYVIRFRDLQTGQWLPDEIADVSGQIVFANDNKTVFVVEKDPTTLLPFRVKRHVLGQPWADAVTVYEESDNTFYTGVSRSKSDRWIILYMGSTLTSEVRLLSTDDPNGEFQVYLPRERGHEYQVDDAGEHFVVRSNRDAPNFQLLLAPPVVPGDPASFKPLLPHRADALVQGYELFNDRVAVNERSGGLRKIRIVPLSGGEGELLAADEAAYVMALEPTAELDSGKLRYSYTSMITPATTYELDFSTGERKLLKRDPVLGGYDPAQYRTEFVFAKARDGAQVPVWLVYRQDTARDGSAPLFISAYGSYGISGDPRFSSPVISLLDRGFVYAIAAIRGGQEMGRQWYEDGKLLKKKNSFNDFIDVTRDLVSKGYGAADKVFARGGSAGGLLMGAVINQSPELYRGIIAHVPFVDVISTMLDESLPLTTGEYDEWGNPNEREFYDYMLSYSPYDQVQAQAYPAMLVTTGLHDSQVQYFEPAKWVARLRERKTDANPLLFKVNMEAGHGGRSGRFNRLEETAED